MKITKRQLRKIIKEEKAILLSESQTAGPPISGDHAIALGGSYGGPDLNYDSVSSADELPAEPHSWADAMDGDVESDEEGQTIIYLSKELHPDVNSFEHDLPQDWDYEESYDGGSFIIYTGLYPGGAPNERAYTPKMESRKISKRQLKRIIKEEKARIIQEMNPDGTISDDEDSERAILMNEVEEQAEELVRFIQMESERIGGDFRGPGIRKEAYRLLAEIVHGLR